MNLYYTVLGKASTNKPVSSGPERDRKSLGRQASTSVGMMRAGEGRKGCVLFTEKPLQKRQHIVAFLCRPLVLTGNRGDDAFAGHRALGDEPIFRRPLYPLEPVADRM